MAKISKEELLREKERLEARINEPHQNPEELASLHGSLMTVKKFLSLCKK